MSFICLWNPLSINNRGKEKSNPYTKALHTQNRGQSQDQRPLQEKRESNDMSQKKCEAVLSSKNQPHKI